MSANHPNSINNHTDDTQQDEQQLQVLQQQQQLLLQEEIELTSGVGTLTYASPEQRSKRAYDEKTDVYSLGNINMMMTTTTTTPAGESQLRLQPRRPSLSSSVSSVWPP